MARLHNVATLRRYDIGLHLKFRVAIVTLWRHNWSTKKRKK